MTTRRAALDAQAQRLRFERWEWRSDLSGDEQVLVIVDPRDRTLFYDAADALRTLAAAPEGSSRRDLVEALEDAAASDLPEWVGAIDDASGGSEAIWLETAALLRFPSVGAEGVQRLIDHVAGVPDLGHNDGVQWLREGRKSSLELWPLSDLQLEHASATKKVYGPLTFAWSAESGSWELGWRDEPTEPLVDDEDEEFPANRSLEAASRAIARLIGEAFGSSESFDALVARLGDASDVNSGLKQLEIWRPFFPEGWTLPSFGGARPPGDDVWSWDADRVLRLAGGALVVEPR